MGRQKSKVTSSTATCLCAPTSHAGSFRCRLHRRTSGNSLAAVQPASRPPNAQSIETFSVRDVALDDPCDLRRKAVTQTESFEPASSKLSGNSTRRPSRLSKVVFADEETRDILAGQPKLQPESCDNLSGAFIQKPSRLSEVFPAEDRTQGIVNQQASTNLLVISQYQDTSQLLSSTKEADIMSLEESAI